MNNTQQLHPAYMVYYNNQINKPTWTFFFHDDLLTARKAAITLAESLFGSHAQFTPAEEVEVHLVEAIGPDDAAPLPIARVLAKRSSLFEQVHTQEDPRFIEEIHPRVNWTNRALIELESEFRYYHQHKLPIGFGVFMLRVFLSPLIPEETIAILFDAASYALALISNNPEPAQLLSFTHREESSQIEFAPYQTQS